MLNISGKENSTFKNSKKLLAFIKDDFMGKILGVNVKHLWKGKFYLQQFQKTSSIDQGRCYGKDPSLQPYFV